MRLLIHSTFPRLLAIGAILLMTAAKARSADDAADADWRTLMRQLLAEDFGQRLDAERKLAATPTAEALERLLQVAAEEPAEAAERAMRILERWLVAAPLPLALAVDQGLSQLRYDAPPDIANLSRQMLQTHRRLRWERATDLLRGLGAKVDWGPDYAALLEDDFVRQEHPEIEAALMEIFERLRRPVVTDLDAPQADDLPASPPAEPRQTFPRAPRNVFLTRQWKGTEADLELLRLLTGASRVQVFLVRGCNVSRQAALQATADLEDVSVEERGPSLGVSSEERGHCAIDEVLPGGAAERAGIRAGDIVVAVDNTPIETFTDLINAVGRQQPDDKVQLRLLRGNELIRATATLGDWNDVDTESVLWSEREAGRMLRSFQVRRMQLLLQMK